MKKRKRREKVTRETISPTPSPSLRTSLPVVARNRMTSYVEAEPSKRQHKKPCHDCPFARSAIPGWLAGFTPEQYLAIAHSDNQVDCHVFKGPAFPQCAGAAIYRRNTCKHVDPPLLALPKDTELVFATPMEFLEHQDRKSVV